jgi:2-C-methyl-D-erythritol 4-phosphate cytidylyltransferase
MNIALIFAGGSGIRMNNSARPKQFLQLYGKEIIIHTIEKFEKHSDIDGIVVVCIETWIDYLNELLLKFNIKKVKWIVPGGTTGQESIYNGLNALHNNCSEKTIVLVHDGVRPLIKESLITECIQSVKDFGSAITVSPAIETIVTLDNNFDVSGITDRSSCFYAKAPQCFYLDDLFSVHKKALSEKYCSAIDSASLMAKYGNKLHTVTCSNDNIKITTPSDFYIFRALYDAQENSQIFGL